MDMLLTDVPLFVSPKEFIKWLYGIAITTEKALYRLQIFNKIANDPNRRIKLFHNLVSITINFCFLVSNILGMCKKNHHTMMLCNFMGFKD